MKRSFWMVATALAVMTTASCGDETRAPMVWGSAVAPGTTDSEGKSGPVKIYGYTLGDSGEDGFGYCRYSDNKFSFAFGTKNPAALSYSSDYYFSITGVEGPPSAEPYDENGEPRTDEKRTFESGEIYTSAGTWHFDQGDMKPDRCLAVVFATGGTGNLTTLEFGKQPFDYLVNIDCDFGLNGVPSDLAPTEPASELSGFSMTVWFKNCES